MAEEAKKLKTDNKILKTASLLMKIKLKNW